MCRPQDAWTIGLSWMMAVASCAAPKTFSSMHVNERQLTTEASGHTLNHCQVFSPDGQWIVFDTRNDDSKLSATGTVAMVNIKTGEVKPLYHTEHQTEYGPGAGAAAFSPTHHRVVFLHGIRNADRDNPYDFTRRTGVAVDTDTPFHPVFLDGRNILPPFTAGALRGGTHAHSWSGDGQWISCTYNDYVLQQRAKTDTSVKDLRTVAVFAPVKPVRVPENGLENIDGDMFAAVVTTVTNHPANGSDEIDKAFDECWIGAKGYHKSDGSWQHRAIAFQGNIRDAQGGTRTEIFVVDIPDDITSARPGQPLQGTDSTRPSVPAGVTQRRISFTRQGTGGPRYWLRSTSDGSLILFLAKDDKNIVQIFGVSPNGGAIRQLTFNAFSVETSFNISPDDRQIAYIADHSVFITGMKDGRTRRITEKTTTSPVNGVIWSPDGKALAYNRYVENGQGRNLQIFLLTPQITNP